MRRAEVKNIADWDVMALFMEKVLGIPSVDILGIDSGNPNLKDTPFRAVRGFKELVRGSTEQ